MDSIHVNYDGIDYFNILFSAHDEPSTHRILKNLQEYYGTEIQLYMGDDECEKWIIMMDGEVINSGDTTDEMADFYSYIVEELSCKKEKLYV